MNRRRFHDLPDLAMNAYAAEAGGLPSPSSSSPRIPVIFRRLHRFHQMDFELAAWQLTYLCIAPRRVYRNVYFHKQTKNTWARDDPAILVLISACLCVSAAAWAFIYSRGVLGALQLALLMILRDFLLFGVVISTILWQVSRTFLLPPAPAQPAPSLTPRYPPPVPRHDSVEWGYTFDVHTNAFFPFYLTLYLAQLFLLPVIRRDNWVCLWAGNTLYLAGYVAFLLPFFPSTSFLPSFPPFLLSLLPVPFPLCSKK
ncbi:UNC-50 family-domain-containing protein [Mycena albidolilacea]|uniref:UNC-50 family-domain-containing protein n=1 Tax=Mycena albidolilacea TaxID=1033008 RepID=A0AAD6ZIC3_9AGAR|nr:UNC-50 family-domain-containing protein [Mycena albidolilacea]